MGPQPATSDHTSVPLLHGRNRLLKLAIVRPWKQLADATAAERCELPALLSFDSGPNHVQIIDWRSRLRAPELVWARGFFHVARFPGNLHSLSIALI